MKREKLLEIVSSAVAAESYAFHTGELQNLSGTVRLYPAVWLAPPVVKKSTGRNEGELTYRLSLHAMKLPTEAGLATEIWSALERDALSIAAEIASRPEVCSISGVSCTPASQSLTPHGEVSVELVCEVTLWYHNPLT